MNVSYRWLRDLATDLPEDPQVAAERLSALGFPVEEVVDLSAGIRDIVLGHVLEVRPHPNADRLRVCQVDGGDGVRSVVCGAPNVEAGQVYPFAPIGATLPGGMKIGKAKLRGELSEGMLCSERELGLGKGQDGLMELGPVADDPGFAAGTPLARALGLEDDRLDVEVTSNRPDLLSHRGVARELSAQGHAGLLRPVAPGGDAGTMEQLEALRMVSGDEAAEGHGVTVRVEAADRCPRYLGLVMRGVRVAPSPAWLQARLRAIGARPINNVVDATNLVLHEWGQPLHAFDLSRLKGSEIIVRRAKPSETIRTLDGVERTLTPEMLAICDVDSAVAVAGVMGGAHSEVTAETTDILLECAVFTPGPIRATRKALGLSTDASYRYERGVDPEALRDALLRCAELVLATAGGTVSGPILSVGPGLSAPAILDLRMSRIEGLLGVPFTPEAVESLLLPLGFEFTRVSDEHLRVKVPGFRRWDVTREVDLIEEVARRHGYDRFPETLRPFRPGTVPDHPLFRLEDRLRDSLVAHGFLEAQTPAFAPEAEGDVEVLNPLSSEERRLRRALLPALLRRVEYNLARGNRDVRLFEIGTVFRPGAPGDLPNESTHLAVVVHGRRAPEHWTGTSEGYDLWDLKGLLESLVRSIFGPHTGHVVDLRPGTAGMPTFRVDAGFEVALVVQDAETAEARMAEGPEPSSQAAISAHLGVAGEVARGALDLPPWAGPVFALELTLPAAPPAPVPLRVRALPQHPRVERDLALIVPDSIPSDRVLERIQGVGGPLLVGTNVFDVYRGAGLPDATRSLAVRVRFQAPDRSLVDEEVEAAMTRILDALREADGIQVRGG